MHMVLQFVESSVKMDVTLIFIGLVLFQGGDSFPSVNKDPVSAIDVTGDEQGRVPMEAKRSFTQFGAMILCKVKRNPLDYNGYGCYCGLGGKGDPVDEIDRCCLIHDKCYDDIIDKKTCGKIDQGLYVIPYLRDGCAGCVKKSSSWLSGNTACQKALCECDRAAARCYKKHDSEFRNKYKNYDQSKC